MIAVFGFILAIIIVFLMLKSPDFATAVSLVIGMMVLFAVIIGIAASCA